MSITRCILRWGVIGGLALGVATFVWPGPDAVMTVVSHARARAQNVVDTLADDPGALRRQLESLAEQYPERIAEVRGEMAEVDHQIGQFERDIEVAGRVVAMTTDDLESLKTLVARAETEAASSVRPVAIRFEGVRFDIEEAYSEGRRINNVRGTYQDRLAHDEVQLKFLQEQKGRLAEILGKLETEYSTYQAQLWQIDREIDAIERNERLIELTKQQQATLASYERMGKVHNLKQLQGKLAELKAIQQAQLEMLEKSGINRDYEQRAMYELDTNDVEENPFETILELGDEPAEEAESDNSIAWLGPVVIEVD